MQAKLLGIIQLVGAALALYYDRAVFSPGASGEAVAVALLAVLFVVVGLHHLAEAAHKKK